MDRKYHIEERCQATGCSNTAYRTASNGERLCGLCSMDVISVADGKLPSLLHHTAHLIKCIEEDSGQMKTHMEIIKELLHKASIGPAT